MIAVAQTGGGVDLGTQRDAATFASRDGGRQWTRVTLPDYRTGVFDPMVVAGAGGRMYVMQDQLGGNFAHLIGANAAITPTIRVWSTVDGWSWDGPAELRTPVQPDHSRMVTDLSNGPNNGRLYIAWNDVADEFLRDHYEIFLQWSDDGGRTFNEPVLVDQRTGGKLVATEPVVLSDGTLLVTWYQYWNPLADPRNDRLPFFVRRSEDGATFAPVEQIFDFGPHVWRDRMVEFSRAFSLPIVMADTSSRSPNRDNIYIVWDDVRSGHSDIWLIRSTDRGQTWSSPLKINDNAPGASLGVADYQMTPTIATAPDGTLGVSWYDRRNDPTRRCWELFFAVSKDAGASFGPNVPIGVLSQDALRTARNETDAGLENGRLRVSFDPSRNIWPGHYSGLAADATGVFHALWLDRRNGAQELFATRIEVGTAAPDRSGLREADVTDRVELIAGTPVYDAGESSVTIPLQVRNVSDDPIHGPLTVRIVGISETSAGASARTERNTREIRFAGKLGTDDVLLPLGISESIEFRLRVAEATGLDAGLDFRVVAQVR
jgi:hypothetical protein